MDPNPDDDASDELEYGMKLVRLDPERRLPGSGLPAGLNPRTRLTDSNQHAHPTSRLGAQQKDNRMRPAVPRRLAVLLLRTALAIVLGLSLWTAAQAKGATPENLMVPSAASTRAKPSANESPLATQSTPSRDGRVGGRACRRRLHL
jgi:hypothetical protein